MKPYDLSRQNLLLGFSRACLCIAFILTLSGCAQRISHKSTPQNHSQVTERRADSVVEAFKNEASLKKISEIRLAPVEVATSERSRVGEVSQLHSFFEREIQSLADFDVVQVSLAGNAEDLLQAEGAWRHDSRLPKAQASLVAVIRKAIERKGSQLGVEKPAELSMELSLYNELGALVWKASFFFRDQAFSENLLNIEKKLALGGGAGWQTLQQLEQSAVEQLVRSLARSRQSLILQP